MVRRKFVIGLPSDTWNQVFAELIMNPEFLQDAHTLDRFISNDNGPDSMDLGDVIFQKKTG